MTKALFFSCCRRAGVSTLAGLAICLQVPVVAAQTLNKAQATENVAEQHQRQSVPLEKRAQTTYDHYILGPGAALQSN